MPKSRGSERISVTLRIPKWLLNRALKVALEQDELLYPTRSQRLCFLLAAGIDAVEKERRKEKA